MDDMNPYREEDLDEDEVVSDLNQKEEESSEHEW